MSSDHIFNTPEFIDSSLHHALQVRTAAMMSALNQSSSTASTVKPSWTSFNNGLGPPDLCYLIKKYERYIHIPMLADSKVGYYHWALGIDSHSPAGVAAYFGDLYQHVEDANWYSSGRWVIEQCIYSSYLPISQVDLRLTISIPGGVTNVCAIDARSGDVIDATPEMWRESGTINICRALIPTSLRLIKVSQNLPVLHDVVEEDAFTDRFQALFFKSLDDGDGAPQQKINSSISSLVFCEIVAGIATHYFSKCRYMQAIKFLSRFSDSDPYCALHLSRAYLKLGLVDSATTVLSESMSAFSDGGDGDNKVDVDSKERIGIERPLPDTRPSKVSDIPSRNHPPVEILLAQADILLSEGVSDVAVSLARDAVKSAPHLPTPWITLAKAFVMTGMFDLALVTLNVVPPPIPSPSLDGKIIGIPETANGKTSPALKWMIKNDSISGSVKTVENDSMTTSVSGAGQPPSHDMEAAQSPAAGHGVSIPVMDLPGASLQSSDADAYSVLVDILNVVGWDALLALRTTVFFMEVSMDDGDGDQDTRTAAILVRALDAKKKDDVIAADEYINNELKQEKKDGEEMGKSTVTESTSVKKKRGKSEDMGSSKQVLCTPWFDSLFTTLYEDLLVFVDWVRGDLQSSSTTSVIHQSSKRQRLATEFLHLGHLAIRLKRLPEAEAAYRRCVQQEFSVDAWTRLLWMYTRAGFTMEALVSASQLTKYHCLHYHSSVSASSYAAPDDVQAAIATLVATHGYKRVEQVLENQFSISPNLKLKGNDERTAVVLSKALKAIATSKSHGFDY